MSKPRAIIVGSGISGLAAAHWLDDAGWDCLIIERAPSIREGGYLIGLTGLGYVSIKHLGIFDALQKVGYDMKENVIYDTSSREIVRISYKDAHGVDNVAVCRGDLSQTLAGVLPASVTIRFGEAVTDFANRDDKVDVTLQNGETLTADLLIGADGIHSSMRDKLFPDAKPMHNLGYSFAVYDVEGHNDINSDCLSYTRPGHMDAFYRLRDNRLAAMHLWRSGDQPKVAHATGQAAYEHLQTIAKGGHPQIADIVQRASDAGAPVLLDSLTMVKLPTWSQGRVLLLGDAAHCLTLMSGQGAAMAMASAEMLGQELKAHPDDILLALANHEKRLRPSITRLQGHSENLASAYITSNAFVYFLRNLILKIMPYSWLVAWHIKKINSEIELTKL